MYTIQFYGYLGTTGGYSTLTKARKALSDYKRGDRKTCRERKYKNVRVTGDKDCYNIMIGCNVYSAAAIVKN